MAKKQNKTKITKGKKALQWLPISLRGEWVLTKSSQWPRWPYMISLPIYGSNLTSCNFYTCYLHSSHACAGPYKPGILPPKAFLSASPSAWSVLPRGTLVAWAPALHVTSMSPSLVSCSSHSPLPCFTHLHSTYHHLTKNKFCIMFIWLFPPQEVYDS